MATTTTATMTTMTTSADDEEDEEDVVGHEQGGDDVDEALHEHGQTGASAMLQTTFDTDDEDDFFLNNPPPHDEERAKGDGQAHDQRQLVEETRAPATLTPSKSVLQKRNKRKNFRPRNIAVAFEDEGKMGHSIEEENNVNQSNSNHPEAMDLSLHSTTSPTMSATASTATTRVPVSSPSLSVVRPEVLFGSSRSSRSSSPPAPPAPPQLNLAAAAAAIVAAKSACETPMGADASTTMMKDAFQEVLKLYGVPAELAATIAQNAHSAQVAAAAAVAAAANSAASKMASSPMSTGVSEATPSSTMTTPPLLSAALMASSSSMPFPNQPSPSMPPKNMVVAPESNSNPPTPPKTPSRSPLLTAPPFLPSLVSLQEPTKTTTNSIGSSPPNFLAAHLNKKMMFAAAAAAAAGNTGGLPMHPSAPPSLLSAASAAPPPPPPPLASAAASVPPQLLAAQRAGMLSGVGKNAATDYTRYFKRFASSLDCGVFYCKDMNYREHYHCTVPMCRNKIRNVFAKKEEMIRHSKWHQKMDEAFKYGFRRVTPSDDCGDQFPGCPHNRKQTHYHCIASENCDKVYISTSDVQMHFNFHRKDNAIQREGFLRFRGNEDCQGEHCPFRMLKTTHFHCNRPGCGFTFKNKADMEKHKNFHMKDEQLLKHGFKKFLRADNCDVDKCPLRHKSAAHIHCVRENCGFLLTHPGQIDGHRRSHEKQEASQSTKRPSAENNAELDPHHHLGLAFPYGYPPPPDAPTPGAAAHLGHAPSTTPLGGLGFKTRPVGPTLGPASFPMPASPGFVSQQQQSLYLSDLFKDKMGDDVWRQYLLHFDVGESCGFQSCDLDDRQHYHCKEEGCEAVFQNEAGGVREHGRNHFMQEQITNVFFEKCDPDDDHCTPIEDNGQDNGQEESKRRAAVSKVCSDQCPHRRLQLHYHCKWENCGEVVLSTDAPFKRLEHYKLHEYSRKFALSNANNANKEALTMTMTTNVETMFKRKRGRPPKNRVVEVWNHVDTLSPSSGPTGPSGSGLFPGQLSTSSGSCSPQAVFTSFKLPKPEFSVTKGSGAWSLKETPLTSSTSTSSSTTSTISAPLGRLPALEEMQQEDELRLLGNTSKMATEEEQQRVGNEEMMTTVTTTSSSSSPLMGSSPLSSSQQQALIKARGTYYPLTALPTHMPQGPVMRREATPPPPPPPPAPAAALAGGGMGASGSSGNSSNEETSPTISLKSKLGVNFLVSCARQQSDSLDMTNPLAKLLQSSNAMETSLNTSSSTSNLLTLRMHQRFGPEPEEASCGRPFCKLKRKAHFHCNSCNQGFTETEKLEVHLRRHIEAENSTMSSQASPMASATSERSASVESPPPSLMTTTTTTLSSSSSPLSTTSPLSATSAFLPSAAFGSPLANFLAAAAATRPMAPLLPHFLAAPGLLPPPFPPPGLLPGSVGQLGPRTFDPLHHPLTRMPGDLSLLSSTSSISTSSPSSSSSLKRVHSPISLLELNSHESELDSKRVRSGSSSRGGASSKDEPVPDGYMRFRFNEDCGFSACNYREHQTHFHCMRKDCNYRFCDKTRFVQHTARHERLDTLCGSDFEGFRGVSCGRDLCDFNVTKMVGSESSQKSSSHFHCLKCDYSCTDTNKVVAHRRQHQKLDSIVAAGFEKFTPTQNCGHPNCSHCGKQTHYHCATCSIAVLGLTQMEAHRARHELRHE